MVKIFRKQVGTNVRR